MSQLTEKVSYLRGLMEGMKLDTETNEGLLLSKIVDVLDSMAQEIADLSAAQDELSEYVDSIDQDLAAVEELFDEEDDEDDEDFEYDDDDDEAEEEDDEADEDACEEYDEAEGCGGDCSSCAGCSGDAMADENYDVDIVVECMCPQCSGTFYVNEDELGDDAFHICPRCGARIHVVPDYDADIPVAALADDEDKDE